MERPDERQALELLKMMEPEKYQQAVLKDKPDIQNINQSIGVEVTQALKESVLRALQLPEDVMHEQEVTATVKERYKDQIVKIDLPLPEKGHKQVAISMANWHSLSNLIEAYTNKVKKLQQGYYHFFNENNLFIFVFGEKEPTIQRLLDYIKQQKDTETYDYVYVFSTPILYKIDTKKYSIISKRLS